jgi:hypothetical protein
MGGDATCAALVAAVAACPLVGNAQEYPGDDPPVHWSAAAPTSFTSVVGGPAVDRGIFVTATRDGGYAAVGFTASSGAGGEDVYVVKADAEGRPEWTRAYGGAGTDNGWSVLEDGGNFVIAGFTDSFGAGDFDCYLTSVDSAGVQLWSTSIGGPGKDRCWGLLRSRDGGYVLVGETASTGAGSDDCYLIKTDPSGSVVWERAYGGTEGDRCFSVAEAEDGGFVLAGQTYSQGAGDRDAYVVRTDESGGYVWARAFGGPASDVGHSVTRTRDGTFLVTGYTRSQPSPGDDPYLLELDASGELMWERVLPLEGGNRTLSGEQAEDGGFILGGYSESIVDGSRAALLVRTDRAGGLRWSRLLLPTTSGSTVGYTARATVDGGAILVGHTTEGSAGDLDLLLLKTDEHGR